MNQAVVPYALSIERHIDFQMLSEGISFDYLCDQNCKKYFYLAFSLSNILACS